MIVTIPDEFDSKFRFILVASERAKQIQNGAPPKIDAKGKPAYVSVQEVESGLVSYVILEEEEEEEEEE